MNCRFFINQTCKNPKRFFKLVPWLRNTVCNPEECNQKEFNSTVIEKYEEFTDGINKKYKEILDV